MSTLSILRQRLGAADRPLRFLVAGVLNTAFGVAVYPLLIISSAWLKQHYLLTLVIAQATSISFAYFTYKIALRGGRASLRQMSFFSSFYAFHCASNIVLLPILVEVLHLNPIVAQLSFVVAMATGGYMWHSKLTFAGGRDGEVQKRS